MLTFGAARCRMGGIPHEDFSAEVELRRSASPELTRRELDVLTSLCRPALSDEAFVAPATAREIAADLVVTSSGDTCAEARTIGRPLLLLDVVQGHGRDNLQHELELGDASVTSPRPADLTRTALAALDQVKPPADGPARQLADWQRAFSAALEKIGLNEGLVPQSRPR